MSQTPLPTFEAIQAALARSGAHADAAEAHGSLCGMVCLLGPAATPAWLAETLGTDATEQESAGLLQDLATVSCESLTDGDMSFVLLLPTDDAPLTDRADNLAGWCQGFSRGLAVAAERAAVGQLLGAGLAAEVLQDFGEIARAGFEAGEEEAEGEIAYAELVEYIRVSVQLIYEEFRELRRRLDTLH